MRHARLLREAIGGRDLAWRHLVGARHVGHLGDDFGLAMRIRRVLVHQPDSEQAGQMIWSR